MSFDFNDRVPIYLQIIEEIKRQVVTKQLKAGEKMPSVRELSEQMQVNPNTVQRAYQELERQGITFTQRGLGNFVTSDTHTISKVKSEMAETVFKQFVNGMKNLGLDNKEITQMIQSFLQQEEI